MNSKSNFIWGCSMLFLAFSLYSCEQEQVVKLNRNDRDIISKRYADSIRILTPIIDSLCTANHDKTVTEIADSIFQERKQDLQPTTNLESL